MWKFRSLSLDFHGLSLDPTDIFMDSNAYDSVKVLWELYGNVGGSMMVIWQFLWVCGVLCRFYLVIWKFGWVLLWRCCLLLGLYGGFNEGSARVLSVFCDPMMVLQWFYGFNKGSIRALWKLWGSMMIIRSFGVLWWFYEGSMGFLVSMSVIWRFC